MRTVEGVRKEEAIHNATADGKGTHKGEEPEPARLTSNAAHVKNTIGQELCRCLTNLIAEVEDHDTLSGLLSRVPSRVLVEPVGAPQHQPTYHVLNVHNPLWQKLVIQSALNFSFK